MAVNLSPVGGVAAQFFTNNGTPLTGGKIYTYAAGTTTPLATYTSASGSTAHTNPIVLDAAGRVPNGGEVWLTDGLQYKFVLKTSTDVLIATYDNIVGINSNFVNYTNEQEIQTATAGQTVFTLTTMQYQPGTNSLSVFVDGVNQYGPGAQYAYLETDSTTVTFVSGLHVGAEMKFSTSNINASSYGDAFQISYTPPFTGSVATNVGDKLAQTINVDDFGATGDGITDDTTAIQTAVNAGSVIYFSAGKTYLVSPQSLTNPDGGTGICINVSSNKTLMMYGATIKQKSGTNGTGGVISNTAAISNVSLYGGTIDGNEANTAGNMNGVLLLDANNCRIQDLNVINTRWIGVGIRNPNSPAVNHGLNIIQGNYINNCLYIGIQCLRPTLGVKILNNTIYYTGDNGIDVEGNNPGGGVGGYGDQIVITGNTMFSVLNGVFLESVGNAVVANNSIKNFTSSGIVLNRINSGSGFNVITGNKISDGNSGVYISNSSGYSLIESNLFKTLSISIYCQGTTTNLSIGKNLHSLISGVLLGIRQGTNEIVYSKMDVQDVTGPKVSGKPFTCSPLSNADNYPNRAYVTSVAPAYFLETGTAAATLADEYLDGNTSTLDPNGSWGGAYSVYTGGETLVFSNVGMNVNYYVTINGTLFKVQSNPSGGVFAVRSAAGVAGDYTSITNGAYTWVEYWPEWQTA